MKLHIFNPEHDMALACNDMYFTPPHAGRQLRADLGFLPALWAKEGDLVLVDDVEASLERVRHLGGRAKNVLFVTKDYLKNLSFDKWVECGKVLDNENQFVKIQPWGWDKNLCRQLLKFGVSRVYLPINEHLDDIRSLSSRKVSQRVLEAVVAKLEQKKLPVVGRAFYASSLEEVLDVVAAQGLSVLKSPWSSSGRGVRYVEMPIEMSIQHWISNVIKQQGGIMVEPYYNKVIDFGMEFTLKSGRINYRGLSLFQTVNGFYSGNILASECVKREILSKYVPENWLEVVRRMLMRTLTSVYSSVYEGPLGVDMMLVTSRVVEGAFVNGDLSIHPCVEVNLRRTMGHVALSLTPLQAGVKELMRIVYEGTKYHLRICRLPSDVNIMLTK